VNFIHSEREKNVGHYFVSNICNGTNCECYCKEQTAVLCFTVRSRQQCCVAAHSYSKLCEEPKARMIWGQVYVHMMCGNQEAMYTE
jgi:hypothetical protein